MQTDAIIPAIAAIDHEIAKLSAARETLQALLPPPVTVHLDGARIGAALAKASAELAVPEPAPRVSRDAPRRARVLAATPLDEGTRVRDIADALDEPQSYVHADLQTLEKKGHVARVGRGTYVRTSLGEVELETVWSGASKRPLIDREHSTQAQRESA